MPSDFGKAPISRSDISMSVATRAYMGTSHTPEKRAESEINDYIKTFEGVWELFHKRAETPEQHETATQEFIRFKDNWLARKNSLLARRNGLMSSFIAGPSGFPVERQRKLNQSFDKAQDEFNEWQNKAFKKAQTNIRPQVIKSTDPNAVEALEAKIVSARSMQDKFKAINKIVRNKKLSEDEKREQIREVGAGNINITEILKPPWGRPGVPAWMLQNNNANIRRMEERIKQITAEKGKPGKESFFAGGRVVEDPDDGRLKVFFDDIPDREMRTQLKRSGFRFAPSTKAWQRQLNNGARHAVTQVLGPLDDAINADAVEAQALAVRGFGTTATGADPNEVFAFKYKAVELDDLIASHDPSMAINPDFPKELQPRIRDRAASRQQITKIASTLNPSALLTDIGTLDRGPMIVGEDNVVESGNGRTIALKLAAAEFPEKFSEYKKELLKAAEEYGLDANELAKLKNPVLTRERITEVDRASFAAMSNQAAVLAMSPLEQAIKDSEKLDPKDLADLHIGDNQSIDQALKSPKNLKLTRLFVGELPENERAAIVGADGTLNQIGLQRLKAAIFAKVFTGESGQRLTQTFFESLDPIIKNTESAIFDALPKLAQAEGLVAKGDRNADLAFGEDLAKAIDVFARLKQQNMPIKDYLSQSSFLGRELTPEQENLLIFFNDAGRSRKRTRELLTSYADAVINAPHPNQGAMFATAQETKGDILGRIIEFETKRSRGETEGLFALAQARLDTEAFTKTESTLAARASTNRPQLEEPRRRTAPEEQFKDWNTKLKRHFRQKLKGADLDQIDWVAANTMRENGLSPSEAATRLAQRIQFDEIDRKAAEQKPFKIQRPKPAAVRPVKPGLPTNQIIKTPTGKYTFVGRVDDRLAFIRKDGTIPTKEEIAKAKSVGVGFTNLKTRVFDTKEQAVQAARELESGEQKPATFKVKRPEKQVIIKPSASISRRAAIRRFLNPNAGVQPGRTRRNPAVDIRVTSKVVAPSNAKTEKDLKLQKKWFKRPATLDFEGVDTKRRPSALKTRRRL